MKTCGECNLCCKVVAVDSLAKPRGTWCEHAKSGVGCTIYGEHPADCKGFKCGWLDHPSLGQEWRPDICKFVLRPELDGARLVIDVDPDTPLAWTAAPYYRTIKQWSRAVWNSKGHVAVDIGSRTIGVFPEEDIDIGDMTTGDELACGYRYHGALRQPFVAVRHLAGGQREKLGGKYLQGLGF